jgi:hypothetical protein
MSLPGRRHGSWINGPDGHVRLIFRMTVHRIHLGLYCTTAHSSAARYLGRRYGLLGLAVRNIHHSTNHAPPLPHPSPLATLAGRRAESVLYGLRPLWSLLSLISLDHVMHLYTCMFAETLLPAEQLLPERNGEGRYGRVQVRVVISQ